MMSGQKPKFAVLMAAYNAERTIGEAVASVLSCPLPFQLYIIDDGSKEPVSRVLPQDERITCVRLEKNVGLSSALNHGIDLIRQEGIPYIARMDADDRCLQGRFEKQLAFMEQNPGIALVGCWARYFDEDTGATRMYFSPPASHEKIREMLCFNSAICHPTWFMRSEIFNEICSYNSQCDGAEDYDLLCRLSLKGRLANIPEYLLDYRVSSQGISLKKRKLQLTIRLAVQRQMFSWARWRCYMGIFQTLVLYVFPVSVLAKIKKKLCARKDERSV